MGAVCQLCRVANNDGDISCMLSQSPCVYLLNNRCHGLNVSTFHFNGNIGYRRSCDPQTDFFFFLQIQKINWVITALKWRWKCKHFHCGLAGFHRPLKSWMFVDLRKHKLINQCLSALWATFYLRINNPHPERKTIQDVAFQMSFLLKFLHWTRS